MSGNRIGLAEKLLTVHQILDGKETQGHAAERLGINVCSESAGRKESSPQSSIPTKDAPGRLPTLSILQRMY